MATDPIKNITENDFSVLNAWNDKLASFLIGNSTVLCVYLFLGVTGNILIIFIYSFRMKGMKDDRYFIPYLAGMDLIACMFGASYAMALNLLPVRFHGDYLCKSLWFANQAASLTAGFMLLVIAIQRYLKVCRPFKDNMTLFWKKLALFLVVATGILLAAPCWIFYGEIEIRNEDLNITGYRCSEKGKESHRTMILAYNILLFVVAVGGILCISGFYVLVGTTIYRQVRYRKRVSISNTKKRRKPSGDSSSATQSEVVRRCYRDSLDIDSPAFDSCRSPSEYFDYEADDKRTSRPSFGNALMVPLQGEPVRRRSFAEELERPIKALRQQLPKVRSHFTTHRCSWMFMLITIVFIVAFIPRITLMVLESVDKDFWNNLTDSEIVFYLFLYRVYLITNVTNPFFYGLFDKSLRRELKSMCCKDDKRKKNKK
ncbi:hypothetical protein FSP39_005832 [Pinctada imbricata]|uniref:G-protein coupled receptors family 1 profile domain-containing protein n=1 Tax=Pinctada imbricata TaxID=66713 RepID=A0AA88XLC5_PINIB|nr:hypothetical protein FSP39_005832 [Pinctada imbricata]